MRLCCLHAHLLRAVAEEAVQRQRAHRRESQAGAAALAKDQRGRPAQGAAGQEKELLLLAGSF